jgi:hypothetical protein
MAPKRGRPVSGDQGSTDPGVVAKRAMWRNQKRQRRRVKKEQEARQPPESDTQRETIERISMQPFSAAGEPALLQTAEGEPQPAIFEGIHVQGIGGIEETGFDEPEEFEPNTQGRQEVQRSQKPRGKSQSSQRGRRKADQTPSVASRTSSLTSWLNQGKATPALPQPLTVRGPRNTASPPPHRDFSFDSDHDGGFGFDDNDDVSFPDHHAATPSLGQDVTQISYEDQLAAAIEASQQDMMLQENLVRDDESPDLMSTDRVSAPRQDQAESSSRARARQRITTTDSDDESLPDMDAILARTARIASPPRDLSSAGTDPVRHAHDAQSEQELQQEEEPSEHESDDDDDDSEDEVFISISRFWS